MSEDKIPPSSSRCLEAKAGDGDDCNHSGAKRPRLLVADNEDDPNRKAAAAAVASTATATATRANPYAATLQTQQQQQHEQQRMPTSTSTTKASAPSYHHPNRHPLVNSTNNPEEDASAAGDDDGSTEKKKKKKAGTIATLPPPQQQQHIMNNPYSSGAGGGGNSKPPGVARPSSAAAAAPAATSTAATTTTATGNNEVEEKDEFGDLDFSCEDFALMDAMTATAAASVAASATVKENAVKANTSNHSASTSSPTMMTAFTQQQHKQEQSDQQVQDEEEKTEDDDPFGDFPNDIDFDELDRSTAAAAAQQQQLQQAVQSPPPIPPMNGVVKNQKRHRASTTASSSADQEQQHEEQLCFLSCSRYKVLHVYADVPTHTKALIVAPWTTMMLDEEEKKKREFHNATSERPIVEVAGAGSNATATAATTAAIKEAQRQQQIIYLRGEWYHTNVAEDDVIHICSIMGRFNTDALPIMLHTCPPRGSDEDDDLVMAIHPDLLLQPSCVSDIMCTRRTVLKGRVGSAGFQSPDALFGTMRHQLLQEALRERKCSSAAARQHIDMIVRENAETLIGCGITSSEAEHELMQFVPQMKNFFNQYTDFGSAREKRSFLPRPSIPLEDQHGGQSEMRFLAKAADVEEPVISPELGLKGSVDLVVENMDRLSLMGVELKTGHRQNTQTAHAAQLIMYVLMLQTRSGTRVRGDSPLAGATKTGVLLYMNNKSIRAVHVAPCLAEIKSLIGQRNTVATERLRASKPRGVEMVPCRDDHQESSTDEKGSSDAARAYARADVVDAPTPAALPELLQSAFTCSKCYANRDCMMYAGASRLALGKNDHDVATKSHKDLLMQFTGHLSKVDFEYFEKWDRLIDLEADAATSSVAKSWLTASVERERATGRCVSSLVFDPASSSANELSGDSYFAMLAFKRSPSSVLNTSLSNLGLEPGCLVVVSTDSTSLEPFPSSSNSKVPFRNHMHLARGYLDRASETHLVIRASTDDLLRIKKTMAKYRRSTGGQRDLHFRVDRDEISSGTGTLRQNLIKLFSSGGGGGLLDNGSSLTAPQRRFAWLRETIVHLRSPVFDDSGAEFIFSPSDCPKEAIPGCDLMDLALEFAELNSDQRRAAERVISARDYTLVQGLPGTGKTSTISFVARLLVAHGKRVLITSYTHAAVDNVMLKLMDKGLSSSGSDGRSPAMVRIGRKASCHSRVHPILVSTLAAELENANRDENDSIAKAVLPTAESLQKSITAARIVGISALSAPRSPLLAGEHFDVVIVDEAGQIGQPAIIGALTAADSFVLVGDHMQLPPLVNSELAEKGGFGVSMLKRLAEKHPDSVAQLSYQYRMHQDICQLSNDIVYQGKLKCANEEVRRRKLDAVGFPENLPASTRPTSHSWLTEVVDPDNAVVFVDTDQIKLPDSSASVEPAGFHSLERSAGRRSGGTIVNDAEASLVRHTIQGLLACRIPPSSIGVICPFRAQLRLLEESDFIRDRKTEGLELSTIDRYQGRDKPVIILSFVRSNAKGRVGRLLEDFRRLNVAVTRAKCKLIMIGSFSTLHTGSDALKPVLNRVVNKEWRLQLPPDALQCYP